jgi:hypothetical protein
VGLWGFILWWSKKGSVGLWFWFWWLNNWFVVEIGKFVLAFAPRRVRAAAS